MVSHAMEDYIAAIWRLTQGGSAATTSEVARQLGVTAASTSYMFKKMAEAGLVEHKEYAGATLSPAGVQAAMSYIRRHRVVERFLVEVLSISWDRADAISDQMEHSLPEEVVERMYVVMGEPATCPHGYPIPTRDGRLPDLKIRPMSEMALGEESVIAQVAEHDPKLLTYFAEHGLKPGNPVRLIDRDRLGETLTLGLKGAAEPFVLGVAIARLIQVNA